MDELRLETNHIRESALAHFVLMISDKRICENSEYNYGNSEDILFDFSNKIIYNTPYIAFIKPMIERGLETIYLV